MDASIGQAILSLGGHNLPQIPRMGTSPRKAVSKASVKEGGFKSDDQTLKIVPCETIKQQTPPCTPVKDDEEARPPSSMPTPPSEPSPGDESVAVRMSNGFNESGINESISAPSPRKRLELSPEKRLKRESIICPSNQQSNDNTSEFSAASNTSNKDQDAECDEHMDTGELTNTKSPSKSPLIRDIDSVGCKSPLSNKQNMQGRAKTKGDIKKKLQKKRNSKAEAEVTVDPEEARAEIAKVTLAKRVALLKEETVEEATYLLGDMFWGKVGHHPWWPCMIAYDPFDGIYFKQQQNARFYHVQFFGAEEERAWVRESALVTYESKEKHLQWLEENRKKLTNTKKKNKMFGIEKRRRPAWDVACKESEHAIKMDRTARRAEYTLVYAKKTKEPQSPDKSSKGSAVNKKRKLSQGGGDADNEKSPPRKKQKRLSLTKDADFTMSDPSHVQFLVFCSKKREGLRKENPGFTDAKIERALKDLWSKLSDDDKSKYIPMGAGLKDLVSKAKTAKATKVPPNEEGIDSKRKGKKSLSADSSAPESSAPESSVISDTDDLSRVSSAPLQELGDLNYTESKLVIDEGAPTRKRRLSDAETSSQASSRDERGPPEGGKGIMVDGQYFEPELLSLMDKPPVKRELICDVCEEEHGEMVTCEGVCAGSFHVSCLGLFKKPSGPFKCDACSTNNHTCFVCKKRGDHPIKCGAPSCGKFYHEECLRRFPNSRFESNRPVCPLHVCATCAATEKDLKDMKGKSGKLYRCVRCPTAYHASDFCVAAGSLHLAGFHIVCSNHFQPVRINKHHNNINVSWCFNCSKGGSLICCDACPAAYHAACLDMEPPEGSWYCRDCAVGRRPLYGDLVWIKFGSYRWWPGEVCHPESVPRNIQEKTHQVGEFPIKFFGTHEYVWLHRGRVFAFQESDVGTKEITGKAFEKSYRKAIKEASIAWKMCDEFKDKLEEEKQTASDKTPASYKRIKTNRPIGNVQVYQVDPSQLSLCECDPNSPNPCGDDSDCVNRMMYYECHASVCPSGDKCENQRFQKRSYPEALAFRFPGSAGWGLKTLVDIKKGQFVNEYVGDLIDEEECRRRILAMHKDNKDDFYFLTLDKNRIIDAGPKGNLSRFMNHSCNPNCDSQKWTVNGDTRVGLFANQDIAAGSELSFNYNLDCLGNEKKKCHCGAHNCSGYLGLQPKNNVVTGEKLKIKKKKKKKFAPKKVYEDECYFCGYGGELIMCDKASCTKVYHLSCLSIEKLPFGKWSCPWHHCDICGKLSVKLCSECPNSFCNHHIEGNIFKISGDRLLCSDHEDILKTVEASKLENEPNSKPPSTPSCSETSTVASDSEAEMSVGAAASEQLVKTVLKAQLEKKITENRTQDLNFFSDSSEAGEENAMPIKKRGRKSGGRMSSGSASGAAMMAANKKAIKSEGELSSSNGSTPPTSVKNAKTSGSRRSSAQSKDSRPNTPRSDKGKKSGKGGADIKDAASKSVDSPMFDDTDSDDFPNLVIDIP